MTYRFNEEKKIDEKTQMRDAVIGTLYDLSEKEEVPRIIFNTADMGAKALDMWREREERQRDGRFNEFGIAEQAMASVAAGMARDGKRPFIYAIANFVTKRIHEFHVLNAGVQKLPYVTIGVGTGFGYPDSGPTHYMTEDISIMRPVPNLEILSPSDSIMAAKMAEIVAEKNNPVYMRLERGVMPILYNCSDNFEDGLTELVNGEGDVLISTGTMVHRAIEVQEHFKGMGKNYGVIDLYRLKPLNTKGLIKILEKYDKVISIEEHLLNGGLGSMISEVITDNDLSIKLQRIGIEDRLVYFYGRDNIQKQLGIDKEAIINKILSQKN